MTRTTRTTFMLLATVMPLGLGGPLGCGLEEITDGGNADAIPADVQAALDESCATSNACHAGNPALVELSASGSAALLDTNSPSGDPYVKFGDIEGSYLARKMLGTNITGAKMPLNEQSPNDELNVAIILGWIAGAEFSDGGGESGTDTSGDTTTGTEEECYAMPPIPAAPSFEADVWPTFEARCLGNGCHTSVAPQMPDAAGALANLVDVPSSATMNYVTPDIPDESYLWHKLAGTQASVGGSGATMPFGGSTCTAELQTIYAWILSGAAP